MNKLFNFISLVALLALTSCNSATFITPEKTTVTFTFNDSEEKVNISADGSWDVKECPDWVDTDVLDGALVIKPEQNETGNAREGNIILEGKGNVVATIKVTQAYKCTHITPSTGKVMFEKEGGTQIVNIDTDGNVKVEMPEGFNASYEKGVLTVTTQANAGGEKKGDIIITSDEQSAIIQVVQKGNHCPTCGGTGRVKCRSCGGKGYSGTDSFKGYIRYACESCGGYGDDFHEGFRLGSGRRTCPTCGGSGQK